MRLPINPASAGDHWRRQAMAYTAFNHCLRQPLKKSNPLDSRRGSYRAEWEQRCFEHQVLFAEVLVLGVPSREAENCHRIRKSLEVLNCDITQPPDPWRPRNFTYTT